MKFGFETHFSLSLKCFLLFPSQPQELVLLQQQIKSDGINCPLGKLVDFLDQQVGSGFLRLSFKDNFSIQPVKQPYWKKQIPSSPNRSGTNDRTWVGRSTTELQASACVSYSHRKLSFALLF